MALPPRHLLMASALRGAANQADAAAQTPGTAVDMDATKMGDDADAASEELCCPKCKYCGPEMDFQMPSGDPEDGAQASPDTSPGSADDQSYEG